MVRNEYFHSEKNENTKRNDVNRSLQENIFTPEKILDMDLTQLASFFLWLFSSLFVFYITERIRFIKENKIIFLKLSIYLKRLYRDIYRLKSSSLQYIKINELYDLRQVKSIWFPSYDFQNITELFPNIIYEKNNIELLKWLEKIDDIVSFLNNFTREININEIKEHLLSWKVWFDESDERYKNEAKYIKKYIPIIDSYLGLIFDSWLQINLINKNNTDTFLLKLKTNFSDDEENNEKAIMKEYLWIFLKIDEYELT